MTTIEIKDSDLVALKDKVILVTGGSSGIGLASAELFLSLGAKVVVGDVSPCPLSSTDILYQHVDVRDWTSQLNLFKKTIEVHGRVDHVFANAGITSFANYMEEGVDEKGDLLPPNNKTLDVNVMGAIYTCKLGIYYLKKNGAEGGSVVITASAAGVSPFALTDYNVSKHAVIGLMRGLHANLVNDPKHSNIRVNALAPLWTASALVPIDKMKKLGVTTQPPSAVARSAAILMADESRNAQLVFSKRGEFKEIGETLLQTAYGMMATGEQDLPKTWEGRREMNEFLAKNEQS